MKILYIITQGECGGAQKNVLDLATGARAAGHKVVVATGRQDTVASQWLFNELRTAGFRASQPSQPLSIRSSRPVTPPDLLILSALRRSLWPLHDLLAGFQIWKLVRRLRPDIVHLHSSKAGSIGSVMTKLSFTGARVVYTVHGFVTAEPMGRLEKYFYRISEYIASFFRDLVITVSARDQAIGFREKLIHSPSVVIYNGVDQAKKAEILPFSAAREAISRLLPDGASLDGSKRVLGVVANFYPSKGLMFLLEAMAVLRRNSLPQDEAYEVPLVIIGDGALREQLLAKTKALGLSTQVFFVGTVDDAYRYLSAFDLVLLPSVKEGFPYILLEALLAGRPFIATHVGGIPELVEKLPAGVARLVPPADPRALAAAIAKFFHESTPVPIRLPELFTLDHMRSATFAEYKRLLA